MTACMMAEAATAKPMRNDVRFSLSLRAWAAARTKAGLSEAAKAWFAGRRAETCFETGETRFLQPPPPGPWSALRPKPGVRREAS